MVVYGLLVRQAYDLGKTDTRYRGVVVLNLILQDGTNTNVSEAVFKKPVRVLSLKYIEVGDGHCDCLVASGSVVVVMANHSVFRCFFSPLLPNT